MESTIEYYRTFSLGKRKDRAVLNNDSKPNKKQKFQDRRSLKELVEENRIRNRLLYLRNNNS